MWNKCFPFKHSTIPTLLYAMYNVNGVGCMIFSTAVREKTNKQTNTHIHNIAFVVVQKTKIDTSE